MMQDNNESYQAWVKERIALACCRLEEIASDPAAADPYMLFFRENAAWLLRAAGPDRISSREENEDIYRFMRPEVYSMAADNPAVAARLFGRPMGRILSWLQTEIRMVPVLAAKGFWDEIAPVMELFIEIFNYFEAGVPDAGNLRKTAYWYISDYSDMMIERQIRAWLEPEEDAMREIIMKAPLDAQDYLYRYGTVITSRELWLSRQMAEMDLQTLRQLAGAAVEDFIATHPEEHSGNVRLKADIGSERLMREICLKLEACGFSAILSMEPVHLVCKVPGRTGIGQAPANMQYIADHAEDLGLFLDGALCDRLARAAETAIHRLRGSAAAFAGVLDITEKEKPLVRHTMGPEAVHYNTRQRRMMDDLMHVICGAGSGKDIE